MEDDEPSRLVRRFSEKLQEDLNAGRVEEHPELTMALIEKMNADEQRRRQHLLLDSWRRDSSPQLEMLEHRRNELRQTMRTFQASLGAKETGKPNASIASWDDVRKVVEGMQFRWEQKQQDGKFRKALKGLRKFGNTVQNHSSALKMLPTNNEYVSLFCGALVTVLKACETHTNVAEILPRYLAEVNDCVVVVTDEVRIFEGAEMESRACSMYTQIFRLLKDMIDWYMAGDYKSLRLSFNENLPRRFEMQMQEIRNLSTGVGRAAQVRHFADAQKTRLYAESLDEGQRYLLKYQERSTDVLEDLRLRSSHLLTSQSQVESQLANDLPQIQEQLRTLHQMFSRCLTGEYAAALLRSQASKAQETNALCLDDTDTLMLEYTSRATVDEHTALSRSLNLQHEEAAPPAPRVGSCGPIYNKEDFLTWCSPLEQYTRPEGIRHFSVEPSPLFAGSDAASAFDLWALSTKSSVLHMCEDTPGPESSLQRIAGQYTEVACSSHVPIISYFCWLSAQKPPAGRTRETIELTALLYSLILQLAKLLPDELLHTSQIPTQSNLDVLDGTLSTWATAIDIFDQLLTLFAEPLLLVVIDGLDWLEDTKYHSTDDALRSFLETLLRHTRVEDGPVVKVLLTTSGRCNALLRLLARDVTVYTPSSRSRRGMVPISLEPTTLQANDYRV